jgi:hypothetical protein
MIRNGERARCGGGTAPGVRWSYQIASTHSGWSMNGFRLPW